MWLADSGTTLLTDPLLTDRLMHLRRKAGPTPELPGPPDAVLLSHLHADHFHLPSLRTLPGEPLLIVPRGAAALRALRRAAPVLSAWATGRGEPDVRERQAAPVDITITLPGEVENS